jgi:hypothetical protein
MTGTIGNDPRVKETGPCLGEYHPTLNIQSRKDSDIMRLICTMLIILMLGGCATEEQGQLISQGDVTWIRKGITTRSEVVERFGSPRFEMPLHSSTTSTTTTTTTATPEGQSQTTTTTVQLDEPAKGTKAIYPYTRSQSTIPFVVDVRTSQFWLVYDENGVVRDYGLVGDIPVNAPFN